MPCSAAQSIVLMQSSGCAVGDLSLGWPGMLSEPWHLPIRLDCNRLEISSVPIQDYLAEKRLKGKR